MRMKKKHKILIIILGILIGLILSIIPLFNYYVKKTIINSFNESFQAELEIGKLRISIFKSTIEVSEILFLSAYSDINDTLMFAEKITIKFKDLDRANNLIQFENILIDRAYINLTNDKNGNNPWNQITPQKQKNDVTKEISRINQYSFFVADFEIKNSIIRMSNPQTNEIITIKNINTKVSSDSDSLITSSKFIFSCQIVNPENFCFGDVNIKIEGDSDFSSANKSIEILSNICVNGTNFENALNINYDKSNNIDSYLKVKYCFENNPNSKLIVNEGIAELNLTVSGLFDTEKNTKYTINLIADQVNLSDATNNLFADFNLQIISDFSNDYTLKIQSGQIVIKTNKDIIDGNINIHLSENGFFANNNIEGSLDLKELNHFVPFWLNINSGLLSINSKLQAELTEDLINFKDFFSFKIDDLNANICNNNLILKSFDFEMINSMANLRQDLQWNKTISNSEIELKDLQNIFKEEPIEINMFLYISKLSFPYPKPKDSEISRIQKQEKDFNLFNKKIIVNLQVSVDTISVGSKKIYDNFANIHYSPEELHIRRIFIKTNTGFAECSLIFRNKNNESYSSSDITIKNIDLSEFAETEDLLSGEINMKTYYEIYSSATNPNIINKSYGNTYLNLRNFRIKNKFTSQYGFNSEYISIDSLDLSAKLIGENISIKPFTTFINNIQLTSAAELFIVKDSIHSASLVNIPRNELSSKTTLLLSTFIKTKKTGRPPDKDIMRLLLEITGSLSSPEYEVYELK